MHEIFCAGSGECLLFALNDIIVFTIPHFYVIAVHSDREPGNNF